MKEKLVNLKTAKLAKEKNFKCLVENYFEGGIAYRYKMKNLYNKLFYNVYARPTQSILQKWLRETHKIEIDLCKVKEGYKAYAFNDWNDRIEQTKLFIQNRTSVCKTYEEALEIGLQEALKLIKVKKTFYRVCNTETLRGLWYDFKGEFTGIIHKDFDFCSNSGLKMDFDPEIVGWLSATDNLEDLYKWFNKSDILKLQNFGWYIHEFEAEDYNFYERFQHLIIKQDT